MVTAKGSTYGKSNSVSILDLDLDLDLDRRPAVQPERAMGPRSG